MAIGLFHLPFYRSQRPPLLVDFPFIFNNARINELEFFSVVNADGRDDRAYLARFGLFPL